MRRRFIIAVALLAVGALSGVAAYEHAGSGTGDWREIGWPFPRDGWPAGRAFRCDVAACREEIEIYVRPKIGFCNCDRGVADDDEVDRVADIDLLSERFSAVAPGEEVGLGEMRGRARRYDLDMADGVRHAAIGIAVSRRCDLFVAAAQGRGEAGAVQRAALAFLETPEMKLWATAALDGQ